MPQRWPTIATLSTAGTGTVHAGGDSILTVTPVYKGRKRSLSGERAADLRARAAAGESKAGLARQFGISRQTLYQYLRSPTPTPAPTPR